MNSGCSENDPNSAVFVQAVILRANGTLETYNPLVIDQGTVPIISPYPIAVKQGDIVGLFGGGDDVVTTLGGSGASQCVNGADSIPFGQVFFCNTNTLFNAIRSSHMSIPPIGVDTHGNACPTVRSFKIVDQDQSDNVQTTYIVTANGQTAQNTTQNRSILNGTPFTLAKNPSDNRLLTNFVDTNIGCIPWKIHDVSDNGNMVATQATDELQAEFYQGSPVALVPSGDPMTGPNNLDMVNAYRVEVDQPTVKSLVHAATNPYCGKMQEYALPFFAEYKSQFMASSSPEAGTNLYDFLVGRYNASRQILGCH